MSTRERVGRYARAGSRWARLLAAGRPDPGVRVFYGHDRVPGPGEPVAGGTAKFQRLATRFPNHPTDFSLLYIGSTWIPRDFRPLLRLARRRDIPLLLNQNGVGYPGWAGDGTEAFNRPLRTLLGEAAHVLYQSEFCKRAADEWIGSPQGTWEVLHNAVDVHHFTPAERPPEGGPVLLLGGDQYQAYRLELGLETLAELVPRHPDARLLVTGRLVTPIEPLVDRLGLEGRVHVLGRYAQAEAPAIFRRAHLLLHTKVNDPCPSLVVEAMASGLPVVYAKSGGVPELVGDDAGIGVPHPDGFERDEPPAPDELADAVTRVLEALPGYAEAARRRAVERFPLEAWLDRHAAVFERFAPR
ncbi:MAG TPA: glycosyltransferase family 4 protein [Gaiellaceae bacterium]|nr:glycosyltransferase family 4 protein [Gaiellaceae bacterium]